MTYLLDTNTCISYLTLITHNTREFSRVDSLRIEDWVATP